MSRGGWRAGCSPREDKDPPGRTSVGECQPRAHQAGVGLERGELPWRLGQRQRNQWGGGTLARPGRCAQRHTGLGTAGSLLSPASVSAAYRVCDCVRTYDPSATLQHPVKQAGFLGPRHTREAPEGAVLAHALRPRVGKSELTRSVASPGPQLSGIGREPSGAPWAAGSKLQILPCSARPGVPAGRGLAGQLSS